MDRRVFLAGAAASATCTLLQAGEADSPDSEWGALKGRFLFDGEPPEPKRLKVDKDVTFVKEPLFDESLLVNEENHGLANLVAILRPDQEERGFRIHPSYEKAKAKPSEMAFRGFCFRPRVTVVRTGQEFKVQCFDAVGHMAKWELFNNDATCTLLPSGESFSTRFAKAETLPRAVSCAIHPWESGVLAIVDHPYVGVSDYDGEFSIDQIPAGKWRFQLWHERGGLIKQVTRSGEQQKLEKGKLTVEIKPGTNDLGDIRLAATLFNY